MKTAAYLEPLCRFCCAYWLQAQNLGFVFLYRYTKRSDDPKKLLQFQLRCAILISYTYVYFFYRRSIYEDF